MSLSPLVPSGDEEARRRIRTSLDESLMVEAAAGTGKTTELVNRLVALLQSGRTAPERVVAVTFTRKAAGELKLRLRRQLDVARHDTAKPEEISRLDAAIARLEEAHVGTIHSFCGELLRERPVEAGIDPAFEPLSEDDAFLCFEEAFRPWIQHRLRQPTPALRRLLSRQPGGDGGGPLDAIRSAAGRFMEWRDFPKPWARRAFDRRERIDQCVQMVRELATILARASSSRDEMVTALRPVIDLALWVRRAEVERARDYDRLEAFLTELPRKLRRSWTVRRTAGLFSPEHPREQVLALRDQLVEELTRFQTEAEADLAAELQSEFQDLVGAYESLKHRQGRLDFVDLLVKTRDLLVGNPVVRRDFQNRFTHLFIDEFQDTDPLQAEILLLLASSNPDEPDWRQAIPRPGKLFIVGDPKQSIYRFRRADVLLYRRIRDRLGAVGVPLVHLTRSFRGVRPIQEFVNAAFAEVMTEDDVVGQPDYLPLEEVRPAPEDRPSVVALPVPKPYGVQRLAAYAIDQSLPEAAAAFAEWLIRKSGWTVADPERNGEQAPIGPRHIAFLFRRFVSGDRDVTREYARELELRGIPHVLAGARSFHEREEISSLAAILTAVEWPDDELSVYAALRGPLFSISDRILLEFREEHGHLRPYRRLDGMSATLQPVAEALQILYTLHRRRNLRPIARTLTEVLHLTRAHAALALRPAGHQVLANVQRLCELARSFEAAGGTSFRAFVDQLQSDRGIRRAETTVLEEGADGVRLMTVHGAKGLEFPVVLLADMTCKASPLQADKFIDPDSELAAFSVLGCRPWDLVLHQDEEMARDQAESLRLTYVAATRARDLVVIPGVGDAERDGWLAVLNPALYPERENWRRAEPAPGCPEFGATSVLKRPASYDGAGEFSVRPGLHRARAGGLPVTWFDPGLLELSVPADYGLRQKELLTEDPEAEETQRRAWESWQRSRTQIRERGTRPSLDLATVTRDLTLGPPPDPVAVLIEVLPRPAERPRGARFGTLVHTVLKDVSFAADTEQIRQLLGLAARNLDPTPEESDAALEAVTAALSHPLLRRAAESPEVRREMPFLLPMASADDSPRRLLEGSADLVFREGDRWVLVDYKTDDPGLEDSPYVRQVQWYAYALTRLSGLPVDAWLLGV